MDGQLAVNLQQPAERPRKSSMALDSISLPDEHSPLPERFKIRRMWEIERANNGRDIRLIICALYGKYKNWGAVATALGLPRPTLRLWRAQLGIRVHIDVQLQ